MVFFRFVGRWAKRGVLVGVAGIGGTFLFGRYEDYYWHQKDPWRSRREGSGFDVQADGTDKVEEHFGWVRDERNNPLLSPTQASSEPNKKQRVVVLGSGWGARFFLQGIDKDKFEVRVVSPRNFFLFTPLLPSTATGTLPSASVCSPVRELISYKAAPLWRRIYYVWRGELPSETRFYPATCTDVDFARKVVRCVGDDGEFGMHYDKLVVAIGGTTNTFGTKGVEENCLFMKEIGDGVVSSPPPPLRSLLSQLEAEPGPIWIVDSGGAQRDLHPV